MLEFRGGTFVNPHHPGFEVQNILVVLITWFLDSTRDVRRSFPIIASPVAHFHHNLPSWAGRKGLRSFAKPMLACSFLKTQRIKGLEGYRYQSCVFGFDRDAVRRWWRECASVLLSYSPVSSAISVAFCTHFLGK